MQHPIELSVKTNLSFELKYFLPLDLSTYGKFI